MSTAMQIGPPDTPMRITVGQYHRMIDAGILDEDDKVELLEGWIIAKMTKKPPHDACITLVEIQVRPVLPAEWIIRVQSAVTTADSEPEPDIAIVRGPARRYVRSHPRPRDLAAHIEVADTSLTRDRILKGRIYARARIPVYWIINLLERQVEVYTDPKGGRSPGYQKRTDYAEEDRVPLVVAGRRVALIPVKDLLP